MRNFEIEIERQLDRQMNEHFNDIFENSLDYDLIPSMLGEDFVQDGSDEFTEEDLKAYFTDELRRKYFNKYVDILVKLNDKPMEITEKEREWDIRYYIYFGKFDSEKKNEWLNNTPYFVR